MPRAPGHRSTLDGRGAYRWIVDVPWDRTANKWQHALVAVALALPTVSRLADVSHHPGALALRIGLVAGLGLWYTYWFIIRTGGPLHLPYLIGGAALWAMMSALDPA